jgi:hypothetical protein
LFPQNDSIVTRGKWLPSIGKVNALFIFAQFPDDKYDTTNARWIKGKEPAEMKKWVDEKWSENPTQGYMTHYFNDMSFNKLKFTGESFFVISPHSREWYLNHEKTRAFIHKELIEELDKIIDFNPFDNWTLESEYKHKNKPDGIVDMIFIIWRNLAYDYPADSVKIIQSKLDFNNDEGDIGGAPFKVDEGKRTIKTWWGISGNEAAGSGVTIRNFLVFDALRTCIHEFSHYILGDNRYHTGYGFWGMLDAWGKKTQVANSYERSLLGWINSKTINNSSAQTFRNIKLRDYVTTGDVIRITIDSSKYEYFYIENHQNLSYWENNHIFGNVEKGIYIIRQNNKYGESLHLIPADGRYDWTVKQVIKNPWGNGMLPVYKQIKADRHNGYHDMEYIPWKWENKNEQPLPIHFTEDRISHPQKDVRYLGDRKDAFKMGYNEVFSPWSNPNSQDKNRDSTGIGFKLNNEKDGIYSLDIFIHTAYQAPPSKPINLESEKNGNNILITWTENIEPDMKDGFYKIYRTDNENPQPADFKIIKKIKAFDKNGNPVTEFKDSKVNQNKKYFYKITAVDSTGLESIASEISSISLN